MSKDPVGPDDGSRGTSRPSWGPPDPPLPPLSSSLTPSFTSFPISSITNQASSPRFWEHPPNLDVKGTRQGHHPRPKSPSTRPSHPAGPQLSFMTQKDGPPLSRGTPAATFLEDRDNVSCPQPLEEAVGYVPHGIRRVHTKVADDASLTFPPRPRPRRNKPKAPAVPCYPLLRETEPPNFTESQQSHSKAPTTNNARRQLCSDERDVRTPLSPYEPRPSPYTGAETFVPIPGAVWYRKEPHPVTVPRPKKSRNQSRACKLVLSGTRSPIEPPRPVCPGPPSPGTTTIPDSKVDHEVHPAIELDQSIFNFNGEGDYENYEQFKTQLLNMVPHKPLPYAARLRDGLPCQPEGTMGRKRDQKATAKSALDPPGSQSRVVADSATRETEIQVAETLFTEDESDNEVSQLCEMRQWRPLKFEVSDTEEGLWDCIGMTRLEFGQLTPTEQGAVEYQHKVQVRLLLEKWGCPLHPTQQFQEDEGEIHQHSFKTGAQPLQGEREPDRPFLENELLTIILNLSTSDQWAVADIIAKASSRECEQARICHEGCDCLRRSYTHAVSLFEALADLNSSSKGKELPVESHREGQGLASEDLNKELSYLSSLHKKCSSELSEPCKQFGDLGGHLGELSRLGSAPEEVKKQTGLPPEFVAFATALVFPHLEPKVTNRWFKAMCLASHASRFLPKPPATGEIYSAARDVPKLYLRTLAAICNLYASTSKFPDWELLAQLILDGHAHFELPDPKPQSMITILAKALDPDTKGPLSLMEISAFHWKTPHNQPQAMTVEFREDPIMALKAMLDQIGPVAQWYLEPYGDSGPRILRILDAVVDMTERLSRLIYNYLDQTYIPESGQPFGKTIPENKARSILTYELRNLSRIVSFFIRNESGSAGPLTVPSKTRTSYKKDKRSK